MTPHANISNLSDFVGQEVKLQGWVYNLRSSGKLHFLLLRDGTGICQCVAFRGDLEPELFERIGKLSQESSLSVYGSVKAEPRSPGGYEIGITDVELVGQSHEYPISPKEHGVGFLMENRHLWIRSKLQWATLRIRSAIIAAIREFFDNRGFVCFDSPIFTPAAVEGTSTLFEVDYHERKAYLAQSGQLYAEAGAMAFGKVYTFGPTFRAEKSKTRRHLMEFWMVEPEVAFMDLEGDIQLAEDFVCHIVSRCLNRCKLELEVLGRDISKLEAVEKPFYRLTYEESLKKLEALGEPLEWGSDFGSPHETALTSAYDKPVFVTHYPAHVKAFYMQPAEDPRYAACFDLLAPEGYGEIIGGSQRIHDYDLLVEKIREHDLPMEHYGWYLDLRRYGTVPHAGFGLGLERTVAWICGSQHLRECIPFPRMLDTLYP